MAEDLVVVNGAADIAARRVGSGPPVVLLHPGVADQRGWFDVVDELSRSHTVVTYDRRGFGATTYRTEPHSALDDLIAVLDAVELGRVHVVGQSMGGRPAIDLALAFPERVASLTLSAATIVGAPPPTEFPAAVDEILDELERLETGDDLVALNRCEARLWLDGPSRKEGAVGGAVRALFLEMNLFALEAAPTGEVDPDGPAAWERLGDLAMPTLCLVGRHDLPHLRDRMKAVASALPDGRSETLPNSAHVPQLDDPVQFAETIAAFLADVNGSESALD